MHILQFWKTWPPVYKRLWSIIALILLASLAFTLISLAKQPAPTFTWQQLRDLQRQQIPVRTVDVGGIDLTVETENYILFEKWLSNPIHLNPVFIDVYFALFATALIIIFSTISVLPRFWFLIAAGSTIFMISSFQFEALEIFGFTNKIPTLVILVLLMGPGLYFQFIDRSISFSVRVLSFLIIIIILGFGISYVSTVPQPLRYLSINTLPAALVLIALLIILVSHEIIASFISLVSQGTYNSKASTHYLIISIIYLINLWLTYLDRINYIEWSYTISPTFLLVISGILALWGIRQREPQYENIITANPFAVYLIASLCIISFAAIGFFLASSNDIVMLSLNDLILYAHIGYGMIFLLYVISNFFTLLQSNYHVDRVLYKPTTMPYFSYRLGGLIFTLALLFYNNWIVPVNHFKSGYNTALGDLFVFENNPELAEGYYKRAFFYAPYNQHAALALSEIDPARQKNYLKNANSFMPTEFTLIRETAVYSNTLEQLMILQEANRLLPNSGVIKNDLGLAYSKLGMVDSAFLYFSRASKNKSVESSSQMNLLGLLAMNNVLVSLDSLNELVKSKDVQVKSNAFSIANHEGKVIDLPIQLPDDSILNLFSASLIGNYLTNHINLTDTLFLSKCIAMALKKENKPYSDIILIPASNACYASGRVNKAFELLQRVVFTSSDKGKHNTTMAIWALDQGHSDVAMMFLAYAMPYRIPQTSLVNAVAVSETGKINESIIAWDSLRLNKDSSVRPLAESMSRVFAAAPSWYHDFTEIEKYYYLHYRISLDDPTQFSSLLDQIINENLKAKALLDRSKKLFDLDELSEAAALYSKLQGLHLTDMGLFSKIKYYELRLFAAQNYFPLVEEQIRKGISFGPYRETDRIYYDALRAMANKDSLKAAQNFNWLATKNYYFDEGVVSSALFFQRYGVDKTKSYHILSEALQVNPSSVKILKAYIPAAIANGYDEYASSAFQTLQTLITPDAVRKFVTENRLSGLLPQ